MSGMCVLIEGAWQKLSLTENNEFKGQKITSGYVCADLRANGFLGK